MESERWLSTLNSVHGIRKSRNPSFLGVSSGGPKVPARSFATVNLNEVEPSSPTLRRLRFLAALRWVGVPAILLPRRGCAISVNPVGGIGLGHNQKSECRQPPPGFLRKPKESPLLYLCNSA